MAHMHRLRLAAETRLAANSWLAAHLALLATSLVGCAARPHLVVFGDSLSDTGNLLTLTQGQQPSPEFYFQGRSADGPVWVDHLQGASWAATPRQASAPPVINYALAGSTACSPDTHYASTGALAHQVDRFASIQVPFKDVGRPSANSTQALLRRLLANHLRANGSMPTGVYPSRGSAATEQESAVMVVVIGSNDYIGTVLRAVLLGQDVTRALQGLAARVVNCTMQEVRRLVSLVHTPAHPMRDPLSSSPPVGPVPLLLVASLPPVEVAPVVTEVMPQLARLALQQALQAHNAALQQAVRELAGSLFGAAPRIGFFDLYTSTLQIRNTATASGDVDVTRSCLQYGLALPAIRAMLPRHLLAAAGSGADVEEEGGATPSVAGVEGGGSAASREPPPGTHTIGAGSNTSTDNKDGGTGTPQYVNSTAVRGGTRAAGSAGGAAGATVTSAALTVAPHGSSVRVNGSEWQEGSSGGQAQRVGAAPPAATSQAAAGPSAAPLPHTNSTATAGGAGAPPLDSVAAPAAPPSLPEPVDVASVANLWFASITGTCDDPNSFFFYDAVHPSSLIHRQAAVAFNRALGLLETGQDAVNKDLASRYAAGLLVMSSGGVL